ncbi:RdgB/HAM1 family non-canonical purine NTP pyrophosphatase [Gimibacter soli]|uniref:dITP/XTP pyrophosphatase n=1 Tax=Gimibacter soli TaxID=3024400 RepID=A0AAF0BMI9_9PROT|nr:RdgB/HAM1 family non-canonical purine NTP pyrophosphatase [Gimibacter soli]WCL54571.1 RdgB/HAM1 family non-canonical purine NTP pyrophosphatase [Gimibacter soli]
MARKFTGNKIVIASHNEGKVREINELLAPFGVEAISAKTLGLPEPEENGDSFIANAEIKAVAAALVSQIPALADDSGLEVNALAGDPGIFSARWAGPKKDFSAAMARVIEEMDDDPDRGANFTCALSLAWPDGHVESFEGKVFGELVWPMRGEKGFGYDPIFVAKGESRTFAEMDPAEKHAMSHRADAFRQLIAACFQNVA